MVKLRDDKIAWREIEGETLMLDLERSAYLQANSSATVLWQRLAEGTTEQDLVQALIDNYDLGQQEAADDVAAFLAECRARDYLEDDEK